MTNQSHASRFVAAGATSSAICAGAGILAFTGPGALKACSAMLVAAIVVALVGYAYADNRRLGWGAAVLIAATLPLFVALYAIGELIMSRLGSTIVGASLIGLSVAVAAGTIALLSRVTRQVGAVPRGAPRPPSER